MTPHFGKSLAAVALALAGVSASAASVNYSGNLGDAANPYLDGSDLGAPVFVDPGDAADNSRVVANNVALYPLILTQGGTLTIASASMGSGGIDSYVSLFSGPTLAATFVASRQDDFNDWTMAIGPGSYWVSIGEWVNMSFAENQGTGTLADGFIGLGDPNWLGNGNYDVTVSLDTGTPPPPVPEPSQAALLALGMAAVAARAWRARKAG